MSAKMLPRIEAVEVAEQPLTLLVRWEREGSDKIDVSDLVQTFRVYAPLACDPALFRAVRVGEHGTDIVWTETIEMSNATLWRLARS